jgi:hypothetical protein
VRSGSETIFLLGGLVLIVLILSVVLVLLFVAYFWMRTILKYLSNSPGVISKHSYLGWDPISRFLMVSYVGALMIFPARSSRKGELSLQDYELFPVKLKHVLRMCCGSMMVLGVIAIGFVLVGRYMGWSK